MLPLGMNEVTIILWQWRRMKGADLYMWIEMNYCLLLLMSWSRALDLKYPPKGVFSTYTHFPQFLEKLLDNLTGKGSFQCNCIRRRSQKSHYPVTNHSTFLDNTLLKPLSSPRLHCCQLLISESEMCPVVLTLRLCIGVLVSAEAFQYPGLKIYSPIKV